MTKYDENCKLKELNDIYKALRPGAPADQYSKYQILLGIYNELVLLHSRIDELERG